MPAVLPFATMDARPPALAFVALLAASTCGASAAAAESPPDPPLVAPRDIEPRAVEPLVPEAGVPGEPGATPEAKPGGAPTPNATPKPDATTGRDKGGFGGAACWGSTLGCAGLGCVPGLGTAVGASVLVTFVSAALAQGSGVAGVCLAVFGVGGGIVIGAPSAVVLGPCASAGALGGGLIGAALDDRSFAPVFLGALPGLGAGVLASAGAVWGLVVLSNSSGDYSLPAALLGASAALAMVAGPLTIGGITIADDIAGPASSTRTNKGPAPSPGAPGDVGDDHPGVEARRADNAVDAVGAGAWTVVPVAGAATMAF